MQTMHLVQAAHWSVPNVISSLHDTEGGARAAALACVNRMRQELEMPLATGDYVRALERVAQRVEIDTLGDAPWVEVTPLAVVTEKPVEAPLAVAHLTLSPEGASVLGAALGALTARLDADWEDQASGEAGNYYDLADGQSIRASIRQDRELVDQCRAILAQPLLGRMLNITPGRLVLVPTDEDRASVA